MSTFTQLDLFAEHTVRIARARNALADFDLPLAEREFAALLSLYPDDDEVRRGVTVSAKLLSRMTDLEAEHGDRANALLFMKEDTHEADVMGWHRGLAREAERQFGCGCHIGGEPAGLHWLLGGALEDAERSLRDTLSVDPLDARARAFLGDTLFQKGDIWSARSQYLRAFLTNCNVIELDRLADPEVAALPCAVQNDYDIFENSLTWVPAVGTVWGIFPLPQPIIPALKDSAIFQIAGDFQGFRFYRLIMEEQSASTHEEKVRVRSQMKNLCPALFFTYLECFYSGNPAGYQKVIR